MSLFLKVLGQSGNRSNIDERYWQTAGSSYTAAGIHVTPDNALKLSTYWGCIRLISETTAMLPLVINEYLADGTGKQRARNHPLYRLLHSEPNPNMTSFDYRQTKMMHLLMRGNAYSKIIDGPRGFVDQLEPLHPDTVKPEILKNGRMRYMVTESNGSRKPYSQDDIFHIKGMSLNGKTGLSVLEYAAESMGMSLAAERFGARFFANNSRPPGLLKTPNKLKEGAAKQLKESWEAAYSGNNMHRVAVLQNGLEFQPIAITNEEAQFLGTREFQAEDVCRWFGVPPFMVGLTSKSTSWGTGLEQQNTAFLTYTMLAWLRRWEYGINKDLILASDRYFASFVVEGLLRGNTLDRFNAYQIAIQNGWMSPNEAREREDMNHRPGGDVFLTPLNMQRSDEPQAVNNHHYEALRHEAAARVVRKEMAALGKAAERMEMQPDWENALSDFYEKHTAFVQQSLVLGANAARQYAASQQAWLVGQPDAVQDMYQPSVEKLVDLMEKANE